MKTSPVLMQCPDVSYPVSYTHLDVYKRQQFYYYNVYEWLKGDPAHPEPAHGRKWGRNSGWKHLYAANLISMPDKWEYPWFAAWDLAFHCICLLYTSRCV